MAQLPRPHRTEEWWEGVKRGRPPLFGRAMTMRELKARSWANKQARGECRFCPHPALTVAFCADHVRINRERTRKRSGSRPWRPGKPGRPPLESYA